MLVGLPRDKKVYVQRVLCKTHYQDVGQLSVLQVFTQMGCTALATNVDVSVRESLV